MNSWPTWQEWWRFGGALALELAVVFAVAKLVSMRLSSASWRRALWQIAALAMLLIAVGELNGVRGWMRLPEKETPPPAETKVVTIKDAEPNLEMFRDSLLAEAPPVVMQTQPAPRPSRWQQHAVWPALIWAIVAGLILFRMFIAQILAGLMRFSARRLKVEPLALRAEIRTRLAARGFPLFPPADDAGLLARARHIAQTLGIRRNVVLLTSARAVAPFTFGVWRPVIVLPRNFSEAFTSGQQDAALAHELAHVANFDSAWRCLSQFTCAVLWWHPLVWLTVLPTVREFLGYDEERLIWATGGPFAPVDRQVAPAVPLPKFRLRQIASTIKVWDGQTLVLGAGSVRDMQIVRHTNRTMTTNYTDKALFFFITPRIIDPAGNPVHSEAELPFAH